MSLEPTSAELPASDRRCWGSCAALGLCLALVAASFFLLSPLPGSTYPGAIPWSKLSILKRLTDLMSLGGLVHSARGVEIKDVAFHAVSAAGLALLAIVLLRGRGASGRGAAGRLAVYAQWLLGGWAGLSMLSAAWSGDPTSALGQGVIYALGVGWAVAVAWTLDARDLKPLMGGLTAITAAAGALCVWYYLERNPHHRPGFPIGNAGPLAASMIPAMLLCFGLVAAAIETRLRDRAAGLHWSFWAAWVGLIPLAACFWLADSRGGLFALLIGLGAMLFLRSGRRVRLGVTVTLAVLIAGLTLYFFQAAQLDATMGRGPSLRFRLYAWRSAAQLWQESSVLGHGAGAYPRLGGEYALPDRVLDPAAFMAELVEHAHNELFEVLTEIGLVGGVTFVGGLLATFLAGAALLRAARARRAATPKTGPAAAQEAIDHWLRLALIGGVLALLADAMFGSTLRLPGVPAIYCTLLGAIWAVARGTPDEPGRAAPGAPAPWRAARRWGTAALAALASVGAAGAAGVNAVGVWHEAQAALEARDGRWLRAAAQSDVAARLLLDPVRRLLARESGLHAQFEVAREAMDQYTAARADAHSVDETGAPRVAALHLRAVALLEQTHSAAVELNRAAPALTTVLPIEAQSAEALAALLREQDPLRAQDWLTAALRAWRRLQQRRPDDVATLLALRRFPGTLGDHIGLLRDALRGTPAQGAWLQSLRELAAAPGFAEMIGRFQAAAGPLVPETDPDSLVVSRAPELHRLIAAWHALRGDYAAAQQAVARAAEIYRAPQVRPRFPTLYALARAEQAEYVLFESPTQWAEAVRLLDDALASLPAIQAQQYEQLALPFRNLMIYALLAGGQEDTARQRLREWLPDSNQIEEQLTRSYVSLAQVFLLLPNADAATIRGWLERALTREPRSVLVWSMRVWLEAHRGDADRTNEALAAARARGVPASDVQRMVDSLAAEFPALAGRLRPTPTSQPEAPKTAP